VTGAPFPRQADEGNGLRADDWALLRELCGADPVFFDLQVGLLGVERQFRGMSRRAGIFEHLEERLRTGLYANEQEAVAVLTERKERQQRWSLDLVEEAPLPPPVGEIDDTRPPPSPEGAA
jgi:DNA sulfur modification protein DndC